MKATIFHNPNCGTSRNTLALIRERGIEPEVIEYLKNPPSRGRLAALYARAGISPRDGMRVRGTPAEELGLTDLSVSDDAILEAMVQNPILIERPLVETDKGVRLCRPKELVEEIL